MAKAATNGERSNTLLSFSEVARRVGKHPSTIRRWAVEGLLPTVRTPSGLRQISEATFRKFFSYLEDVKQG